MYPKTMYSCYVYTPHLVLILMLADYWLTRSRWLVTGWLGVTESCRSNLRGVLRLRSWLLILVIIVRLWLDVWSLLEKNCTVNRLSWIKPSQLLWLASKVTRNRAMSGSATTAGQLVAAALSAGVFYQSASTAPWCIHLAFATHAINHTRSADEDTFFKQA